VFKTALLSRSPVHAIAEQCYVSSEVCLRWAIHAFMCPHGSVFSRGMRNELLCGPSLLV